MRTCETCGAELVRHRKHSNAQWAAKRFCDRACSGVANRKPRACACGCGESPLIGRKYVKGHLQTKLTTTGYRRVFVGKGHPLGGAHGLCLEHRLVLFNAGVDLPRGYDVHHRNGDKTDNRIENLQVLPRSEHSALHARERGTISNQFGTFPLRRRAA